MTTAAVLYERNETPVSATLHMLLFYGHEIPPASRLTYRDGAKIIKERSCYT